MFVWRLFYDVVPVDSVLIKCRIPLASKCLCCTNASQESAMHLFLKGTLATYVWSHFNLMFDICPGGNISQTLELWFQRGKKGSMEHLICTLTPLMILWEVWRERCSRKYEEKYQWQTCSIIYKIRFWIIRICDRFTPTRRSSEGFLKNIGSMGIKSKDPPIQSPKIVYWQSPTGSFVALNVDGASQNGVAAGGGVIRNSHGVHIANFFSYYEEGTNNLAETRALLDGLVLCEELGIDLVLIQTDSMLVVKWFLKLTEIPWHLRLWWRKIRDLTGSMNVQIIHIYREGNYAADYLSKKGINLASNGAVNHNRDKIFKQLLVADEHKIPYLRQSKR
ncbi:Ribonuclease h domain [Thalictrum thalictroides]|uniref:Ribonuclease h domain n=1 Tax=Thalictrum thalictroides TaxID=46969 RepID=A0A7J6VHL0_THATH|nr:Ribonuclease h domain [Thalictrum thalictroides]